MAEVALMLFVVAMLVLKAAAFVALVFVAVRLAIGTPIVPQRERWIRRLRTTVSQARHYDGSRP